MHTQIVHVMRQIKHAKNGLALSVCHAVKEDPVLAVGSVLDERHVVARLDAEHREQLQLVSDERVSHAVTHITPGDVQRNWLMGPALRMSVHLDRKKQ